MWTTSFLSRKSELAPWLSSNFNNNKKKLQENYYATIIFYFIVCASRNLNVIHTVRVMKNNNYDSNLSINQLPTLNVSICWSTIKSLFWPNWPKCQAVSWLADSICSLICAQMVGGAEGQRGYLCVGVHVLRTEWLVVWIENPDKGEQYVSGKSLKEWSKSQKQNMWERKSSGQRAHTQKCRIVLKPKFKKWPNRWVIQNLELVFVCFLCCVTDII